MTDNNIYSNPITALKSLIEQCCIPGTNVKSRVISSISIAHGQIQGIEIITGKSSPINLETGIDDRIGSRLNALSVHNDHTFNEAIIYIKPHLDRLIAKGAEEELNKLNLSGLPYDEARVLVYKKLEEIDSESTKQVFYHETGSDSRISQVLALTTQSYVTAAAGIQEAQAFLLRSDRFTQVSQAKVETKPQLPPEILEAVEKARESAPTGNPAFVGAKPVAQVEPAPAK